MAPLIYECEINRFWITEKELGPGETLSITDYDGKGKRLYFGCRDNTHSVVFASDKPSLTKGELTRLIEALECEQKVITLRDGESHLEDVKRSPGRVIRVRFTHIA